MKKITRLIGALTLLLTPLLSVNPVAAAADTCTWTGSSSADWSNGSNWSGCDNGGVPESGDTLTFPDSASNKNMNNDLVGLIVDNIGVGGTGYVISGNNFTISGVAALDSTESLTINANITYTAFNIMLGAATNKIITINGITNFSSGGGEVNVGVSSYNGTVDFVGNITGNAASQFIAASGAKVIVRGAANTYTASTVGAESNAFFECRSATCFGDNTNDIYMGGGGIDLFSPSTYVNDIQTSTPTSNVSALWAYDDVTLNGNTTINDSLYFGQATAGKTLTVNGNVHMASEDLQISGANSAANVVINGDISGNYGVYAFSSHLTLAGANTYTGGTGASSGAAIITVTNTSGLGDASGSTEIGSGDVLEFDLPSAGTIPEQIIVQGAGTGNGALVQKGESTTLSGNISISGNTTFGVDSSSIFSAFNLSGIISGTGDITLLTSPTTVVNNSSIQFTGSSANTYVGKLFVNGVRFYPSKANNVVAVTGDIDINASASKRSSAETAFNESIADSSHITLTNSGANIASLAIGTTASETIGYITGDGTVTLGDSSVLVLTYNGDYTFGGIITKFSNVDPAIIVKQGSGNAIFTGGVSGSAYPALEADNGTLTVNSSSFTPIDTDVLSGATLKGSGSLGSTNVLSGGIINVGNSPGCMTLSALNMAAGSIFTEEITGNTACTQYDKTTVSGAAVLNSATLNISLSYTPTSGTVFTILQAGSVTGTFNGLPEAAVVTVNGVQFRINYTATAVTLTVLGGELSNTGQKTTVFVAVSVIILVLSIGLFFATKRSKLES